MSNALQRYEDQLERAAARRAKRRASLMKVSGKSVFGLQRIIRSRGNKARHGSARGLKR